MKIGTLADRADVSIQTVRFYERRGLIPEPPRTDGGQRTYPERTTERIGFIKRAQEIGFTLEEIGELLALRKDEETSNEEVRAKAASKLAEIEEKLDALEEMRGALQGLIRRCARTGPDGDCPILDEFASRASS